MIPKKREDYIFHVGDGRPFEMNPRYPIEQNDAERQTPKIIHLSDLNGDRMPKNFHKKAGRVLPSFTRYWTKEEMRTEQDDGYDVE